MSVPVGITVPKLLPVTSTFAPAFAAYFVLLNLRVSLVRQASDTYIGVQEKNNNNDTPKSQSSSTSPAASQPNHLLIASRSHGNFVENVPYALLVAAIVEANGGNPQFLTGALAILFFFRIVHVEFGIRAKDSLGWGRPVGYFGTLCWIAGLSGYAAWLAKSYWGF